MIGEGRVAERIVERERALVVGFGLDVVGVAGPLELVGELGSARGLDHAVGEDVYTIGLGNPLAASELARPDMAYLASLANEHGKVNSEQPSGKTYFAPSAEDLASVFRQVAADLIIRLSR